MNRTLEFNDSPRSLLTLSQAWETLVVPEMDEITDRTLAEYRQCLAIWSRLSTWPSEDESKTRHNPPVSVISREIVKAFRDKCLATPYKSGKGTRKRSPATVNRIMRDLHVILSPFWPADRINPGGLGLVPLFKWPKSLCRQKKLPFVFTPQNLDQLYLQAGACKQTPGCRTTPMNSARLWRLALVLALNCGARTWDLFDLRWDDIRFEEFEFGSVLFGARKTLKLHRIPLNKCASAHLADMKRRPVVFSDRVFPGFSKGTPFYNTWARICDAAKVVGTFESMRKTSVTRHNSVIWNSGFWLSGHIEPGVFGHYDNPSDRIFEAVYKLEQPPEFLRAMEGLSV